MDARVWGFCGDFILADFVVDDQDLKFWVQRERERASYFENADCLF